MLFPYYRLSQLRQDVQRDYQLHEYCQVLVVTVQEVHVLLNLQYRHLCSYLFRQALCKVSVMQALKVQMSHEVKYLQCLLLRYSHFLCRLISRGLAFLRFLSMEKPFSYSAKLNSFYNSRILQYENCLIGNLIVDVVRLQKQNQILTNLKMTKFVQHKLNTMGSEMMFVRVLLVCVSYLLRCLYKIGANGLRLGGRFNAAKPLLPAVAV